MHGSHTDFSEFCTAFEGYKAPDSVSRYGLCPPATLLSNDAPFSKGGQDCHHHEHGAYTGDLSASMLKEAGADMVIVGHSERRQYHQETNAQSAQKAAAAHKAGLFTILCVGESLEIRQSSEAESYVCNQLKASLPACATSENTVIAYEPIWAIGTGEVATIEQIEQMHEALSKAANLPVLYGGSVKPENASEILHTKHVNGVLVGGASLQAESFKAIIDAAA